MNYEQRFRKIQIIGDIDENAYKEFVDTLDGMEDIAPNETIFIELTSHGGDAQIALAFYDRIRLLKGNTVIYAFGIVASAAVLILAAGDKRYMAKNAWVMVHEDTTQVLETDRVSQAEKQLKVSRRMEEQWNRLLSERTKTSAKVWQELHENETHLDANECLKLGLITKVI